MYVHPDPGPPGKAGLLAPEAPQRNAAVHKRKTKAAGAAPRLPANAPFPPAGQQSSSSSSSPTSLRSPTTGKAATPATAAAAVAAAPAASASAGTATSSAAAPPSLAAASSPSHGQAPASVHASPRVARRPTSPLQARRARASKSSSPPVQHKHIPSPARYARLNSLSRPCPAQAS